MEFEDFQLMSTNHCYDKRGESQFVRQINEFVYCKRNNNCQDRAIKCARAYLRQLNHSIWLCTQN